MPTKKLCPAHNIWYLPKDGCPGCPTPKKSKKYGGVAVVIPPNMRSVK